MRADILAFGESFGDQIAPKIADGIDEDVSGADREVSSVIRPENPPVRARRRGRVDGRRLCALLWAGR